MGLSSIPWLNAILSVLVKILHSIWNAATIILLFHFLEKIS